MNTHTQRGAVMSVIGKSLKKYREIKGLTQQEVWEAAGISKSSYTSYEAGKAMPSADKIVLIAEILDVTTDQILKDNQQPLSKDLEYAIRRIQDLPIELQQVAKTALRGLILGLEQDAMRQN